LVKLSIYHKASLDTWHYPMLPDCSIPPKNKAMISVERCNS